MTLEALPRNPKEATKESEYSMAILGRETVGRWTSNAFEMAVAEKDKEFTLADAAREIKKQYDLPDSINEIVGAALDFRKLLIGAREHAQEIDPHEKDPN